MTREIKFRAWDGRHKNMHEGVGILNGVIYLRTGKQLSTTKTLMQFTGLKDKNGKEIYEGDVVRRDWEGQMNTQHSETYEVYWANGFYLKPQPRAHPAQVSSDVEIIGNIYENPALLTEPT